MIRNAIIVVLMLAAVAFGIIGAVVGLGRSERLWNWDIGMPEEYGFYSISVGYGLTPKELYVSYDENVDQPEPLWSKEWSGPGWLYKRQTIPPYSGNYIIQASHLLVSYRYLMALSFLLGAYPTIAFIRGPLRRWRRRRKGLCLKCGYDLTGNESGICSECGSDARNDDHNQ